MDWRTTRSGALFAEAWQAIQNDDLSLAKRKRQHLQVVDNAVPEEEMIQLEAGILGARSQHDDAIALLSDAAGKYPKSYHISFALAWNLAKVGRWSDAIQQYQDALDIEGVPKKDRNDVRKTINLCRSHITMKAESGKGE